MTGAPTHRAGPVIDLVAGLERVMGDRDLFLRVLGRFASDYRDLSMRLNAALDAGDAVLAHRIAHTLKGAAGMVEAARLRQLALEVELALKTEGVAPPLLIAAMQTELTKVLVEVERLLAAPRLPPPPALPVEAHDLVRLREMLDIGDGRAPELVDTLRPRLLASLGGERMAALETAIKCFDFEHALLLLDEQPV